MARYGDPRQVLLDLVEDPVFVDSCVALTRRGKACRNAPLPASAVCRVHQDAENEDVSRAGEGARRRSSRSRQGGQGRGRRGPGGAGRGQIRADIFDLRPLLDEAIRHLEGVRSRTGQAAGTVGETLLEHLSRLRQALGEGVPDWVQGPLQGPGRFDWDSLKGLLEGLHRFVQDGLPLLQRQLTSTVPTDDYGMDEEFFQAVRPFVGVVFRDYFRTQVAGVENVPSEGPVLLVGNHSGVLPWDGAMLVEAIWATHRHPRHVRVMVHRWLASVPFLSPLMARMGHVLACQENGRRMLSEGRLMAVFPEGVRGAGKLYKDRYRLARFGRGGFIRLALETQATIVPVSIVGAEETYPVLMHLDPLARVLGLPYLPITPTFPWLGLLGLLPLPTRWSIRFGRPLRLRPTARDYAGDHVVVSLLNDRVRAAVQHGVDDLLAKRPSVF